MTDQLARIMPQTTHAGETRSECSYDAANYLIQYVDWLSSGCQEETSPPDDGGMPIKLVVHLEIAAQEIHDNTPTKTQDQSRVKT